MSLTRARGLNHRQFKRLLDDMKSEYSDVLYHNPGKCFEKSVESERRNFALSGNEAN